MIWWLLSRVLSGLTYILPSRNHVVVNGHPATEGNAVETVRALEREYSGTIFWIGAPTAAEGGSLGGQLQGRYVPLRYWSPSALYRYVTAQAVFYTHGLYGNPRIRRNRAVVNLWHGHGIKNVPSPGYASHLVVGTNLHADLRASVFGVQPSNVLRTGTPRNGQFTRPATESALVSLGIQSDRPFVVWMPTYRIPNVTVGDSSKWAQVEEDERSGSATSKVQDGLQELRRAGITVVVRAHPADSVARALDTDVALTSENLAQASASLYQVLAASSGLITDYSGVWFDYLLLDKPIAFFMPDLKEYQSQRGLSPADIFDWLPGQRLRTKSDFEGFGQEILGIRSTEGIRRRTAQHIGLLPVTDPAGSLILELSRRGHLPLRNDGTSST
jgi:CDP-glycerol glycerophosphotransferase